MWKRSLLIIGLCFLGVTQFSRSQPSFTTGSAQTFSGQQTATGSAVALNSGTSRPLKTICVKALHANTMAVYLGGSGVTTATGMELQADQSYCAAVTDAVNIYLVGTGSVSWIGQN